MKPIMTQNTQLDPSPPRSSPRWSHRVTTPDEPMLPWRMGTLAPTPMEGAAADCRDAGPYEKHHEPAPISGGSKGLIRRKGGANADWIAPANT